MRFGSLNISGADIFVFMAPRNMTQAAFFVLTALADQPRHGYGILREVEELSDGRCS